MTRSHIRLPLVLSVLLVGATASAQTPVSPAVATEARAHFDRGLTLLGAENYDGALAEFERSYALSPRPSVLYNMGVTLQSLRRYPDAVRALERYLREAGSIPAARRTEVDRVLGQLRSLIAHVTIDAQPAGATIRLDERAIGTAPLAQPVDVGPGSHHLEVWVGGAPVAREDFTIASGESRTVRIAGAPPVASDPMSAGTVVVPAVTHPTVPTTPPDASTAVDNQASSRGDRPRGGLSPAFFAAGAAVTGAAGIGAIVTGVLTLGARAEFETLYADDPRIVAVAQRGETLRTLTNVLLIGTGVFGVASIVLLTQTRFAPSRPRPTIAFDGSPYGAALQLHGVF